MRKFFVSAPTTFGAVAGLAVAGAASLQLANAQNLNSMEASKLWSVSGTLRGFYDDNYNTAPSASPARRGSYGFEVSPSLSLNVPLQQTEIGARATYGLYYYQDRMNLDGRPIDQTGQMDLWLDHAFTERWQAKVQDSLAVGQEPELINSGVAYRLPGSNLHNTGIISVDTQWTRLMGTEISYQNNLYHYSAGFYQALLDLIRHDIALNVNWRLQPSLLAFVGYQYEQVNYTGNDPIGPGFVSDNRNNRSHYGYVGAQYNPLNNVELDARAGIQYVDYYNPPAGSSSTDTLSPYANIAATYTYLPGSYVQFGFTQARNATDVANDVDVSGGKITLDQESSTVYGALNHQITPRITGNLVGKIQYSTFNQGSLNNESQTWYSVGLNLAYAFDPHLSAEVGYNFDYLTAASNSQIAPGYHRNRIYIGVTGTY